LEWAHIEALDQEPEYFVEGYGVVARTLAPKPFGITRENAAEMIGIFLHYPYLILNSYKERGIQGLRFLPRRLESIPNRTPKQIENEVVTVRRTTGFGSRGVAVIVNISLDEKGRDGG